MISVTNNSKIFFEEESSVIYIYGAGDYGKWVAKFMQRCNMDFEGFIDKHKQKEDDCYVLGKKVIHPSDLKILGQTRLRIILASLAANEMLMELIGNIENKDILCMFPIYNDLATGKRRYDINKFLSYFRAKLITVEVPTIFSDRCTAGFIYRALGQTMISPTINTAIYPKDFLKICRNPRDYFSEDMVFGYSTIALNRAMTVGKVKDVEVLFAHTDNGIQAIRRWNKMRKWINWDCLVFIMSDDISMVSCQMAEEFCSIKHRHLLLMENTLYAGKNLEGCMFVNHRHFHDRDRVIESWFDLVGWINGESEV